MRIRIIVPLLALALGGCGVFKGSGCDKPREYTNSESIPPLEVPAGLDLPDTRSAMRVPALDAVEKPRGPHEPCLDEPPLYAPPAATGTAAPST
ncbi:MAG: hypothetical protein KIT37_11055 [Steroidobacteraceae bacterium]|nr:hypothetical protein [Steroidobacteraceae bacterium]